MPNPDRGPGLESRRALAKWVVLSTIIGAVAGIGAIVFFSALHWATELFLGWGAGFFPPAPAGEGSTIVRPILRPWLLPAITTLGGLLSGLVVYTIAPEAEGHGTDAAIEAFHHRGGRVRRRVPAVKIIASAITIGSGGSGGREGPTAQISSGFGSMLADWLHLPAYDRRIALATGMGAGIGAIFRAPLGGAMLAAEIMYRHDLEIEVLIPSLIASIIGYSIFGWWTGWEPVFGSQTELAFNDPRQLVAYAVLGVLCGLFGLLYARCFYGVEHLFHRLPLPRIFRPALGGLLVGLMGLAIPQALHTGYGWEQLGMRRDTLLALPLWLVLILPLAKIVATSLSIGSGGSGGIFGPALVIGGFLGAAFWRLGHTWFPGMPATPAPFVIVGMMALFGGIAHAPMAVMLMVAEMTGNLSLLAPAMIALGLSTLIAGDETIYTAQLANRAESPAHRYRFSFPLLSTLPVRRAMVPPAAVLHADLTVAAAERALRDRAPRGAPVLDAGGAFLGIATLAAIERVAPEARSQTALARILEPDGPQVAPNDTLDQALQQMAEHELSWLPVVEPGTRRVLGILTVAGALQEYRSAVQRGARRLGSAVEGTLLIEARIEPGAPLAWQRLSTAGFPPGVVVVALRRHGEVIIPRGESTLQPGDVLTLVVSPALEDSIHEWLAGHARRPAAAEPPAVVDGRPEGAPIKAGR